MGSASLGHPNGHDLERFMGGRLDRGEARDVVRHLLTGCAQCVGVTRHLWLLREPAPRGLETPPGREAASIPLKIVGSKG